MGSQGLKVSGWNRYSFGVEVCRHGCGSDHGALTSFCMVRAGFRLGIRPVGPCRDAWMCSRDQGTAVSSGSCILLLVLLHESCVRVFVQATSFYTCPTLHPGPYPPSVKSAHQNVGESYRDCPPGRQQVGSIPPGSPSPSRCLPGSVCVNRADCSALEPCLRTCFSVAYRALF